MPLSNYALDKFVAPKLSELTEDSAPGLKDYGEVKGHWLADFVLKSIFITRIEPLRRQVVMDFLRKVEGAFREYEEARELLSRFLAARTDKEHAFVYLYFHCLRHFETSMILAYGAYMVFEALRKGFAPEAPRMFEKEDKSGLQRLNRLQNVAKHASDMLMKRKLDGEHAIPLWLTNRGIECSDCSLSFAEFAELLRGLGDAADTLLARMDKPGKGNGNM